MAMCKSCFVKTSKQSAPQRMHERKMYAIGQQQYNCFGSIEHLNKGSAHRATAVSNLKALKGIFNAVLLCGRQGLALRGRTDESSNFRQIINLIAKRDRDMQAWLTKQNTYKWVSHDIMNEILGMASHAVLQDLVKEVQAAKYFSIVCDKTTGISTMEQLSVFSLRRFSLSN